eukprot:s2066_g2.t1
MEPAANSVEVLLRSGQVIVIDNWRFAHGRLPYEGARNHAALISDRFPRAEPPKFSVSELPRLAAAARPLDALLRRTKGFVRHRTLLHGDFKTANLFLRDVEGLVEAAVVDFEFAGPGLVAVDLANFLFPDLKMNLLPMEGELLEFYHAELLKALDEFGTGSDFPLSTFLAQYTLARCDYMRYMLGRGWTACSAADAAIIDAVDKDLQHLDGGQLLSSEGYAKAISDLLAKS